MEAGRFIDRKMRDNKSINEMIDRSLYWRIEWWIKIEEDNKLERFKKVIWKKNSEKEFAENFIFLQEWKPVGHILAIYSVTK